MDIGACLGPQGECAYSNHAQRPLFRDPQSLLALGEGGMGGEMGPLRKTDLGDLIGICAQCTFPKAQCLLVYAGQ